ncbi:phosphohydrolase [Candidatus Woesebacteria bacterium RIFCSPHIGHO2_01_FULL_37_10]|uniref:Phosphohydrolase n=1 Tax=Candidatus Woesebacteria bacterium RIFCSPHIGHO2_01_FULL_37_10 TaxID=1802489 RepID=A0A1F7XUB4_9BACT|nr:MAG: phosphohydrolase [Candidatus Woesebacteria bacterium RIFCSPHIGHO2_01_FULL_37_10]
MKSTYTKDIKIYVPAKDNNFLKECLDRINKSKKIYTLWKVINVNAIDRLGMPDHGIVHFQIVANIALRLSRILTKNGVVMSAVKDFGLTNKYSEVIIFLASVLHDLGMTISREGHEEFSLILANEILYKLLKFLPISERTIVASETLHAIIAHRKNGTPYTLEAGIIRVADALDMSEGRSRISYEAGNVNIHSISAAAIDNVEIKEGTDKFVQIVITMNNSAGIFQVDELLKNKLKGSKLEEYVEVIAYVNKGKEKKLIKSYKI